MFHYRLKPALNDSSSNRNGAADSSDPRDVSFSSEDGTFWTAPAAPAFDEAVTATPASGAFESTLPSWANVSGTSSTSTGTSAAAAAGTYTIVPVTNGGMTIDLWFVNADNPTPAFEAGIEQAAAILSSEIANKITVNIIIDYKGSGGGAFAGPDNGQPEPYSVIRDDLQAAGTYGASSLPSGNTIDGSSTVMVWNAELKALGLMDPNDTTTDDGSASFATDIGSSLLVGVALHELTHALGRIDSADFNSGVPDIMEFYTFTSAGAHTTLKRNGTEFFSLDGGTTKLVQYGKTSDWSDFLNSSSPEDPFNEFYDPSTVQSLTTLDLEQMGALGFTIGTAPTLFAAGADTVDFNNLTSAQQAAITNGADIYHGLGGNDVVTLPTEANYNEGVGSGLVLGWTDTSSSTFYTGSKPGNVYTVSGEDGDYTISAGGGTDIVTISGGGTSIILPGSGKLSASIAGGGTLTISGAFVGTEVAAAGGTAVDTILSSGAVLTVSSGGVASSATIGSGGTEFVSDGACDLSATISGGTELDYGIASAATVYAGSQIVEAGGTASGTIVSSGGTLDLLGGATTAGCAILPGGFFEIGSGYVLTNYVVSGGVTLEAAGGGSADGTTVDEGGTFEIFGGAATDVATIAFESGSFLEAGSGYTLGQYDVGSGLTIEVASGGTAAGASIESGGSEIISSGGLDLGAALSGGSVQDILKGGTASGSDIGNGAVQDVFGRAVGATVESNGTQYVESGGVASATTVSSGGTLEVLSGGSAVNPVVAAGGTLEFGSGARASGLVVSNGETLLVSGGQVSSTTVLSGGMLEFVAGATQTGTRVSSGGTVEAGPGETLSGFGVSAGGLLEAGSGGIVSNTRVSSGGTLAVLSGGLADPTTILAGGTEIVSSSGTDFGAQISGGTLLDYGLVSGAILFTGALVVDSGGTASGSVLRGGTDTIGTSGSDFGAQISAGTELVFGFASGATVSKGSQAVQSGGTASGTAVHTSASLLVSSGGTAIAATISSGGTERVSAGGFDNGAIISGGRQFDFGIASGASVFTGSQAVQAGGIADSTLVRSGGTMFVSSGGNAVSATILSGGSERVSAGGVDSGATISGGRQFDYGLASGALVFTGSQAVQSGGTARGTTVFSGGTEVVSARGSDFGAQISGGTQLDFGLASGATVFAGIEVVENGGTASGTIVSSGGTLELLKGGKAIGTVLASGGTFEVGSAVSLSGFTVSEGVTLLVSRGSVTSTTILSGGTLELVSGATQTATTISSGGILEIGAGERLSGFTASGSTLEIVSGGTIVNTTVANDGTLSAGGGLGLVSGTLTVNGATSVTAGAVLETTATASATLNGAVDNEGTLFASGSRSIITIGSGATVIGGGIAEVGNGIVNIQAASDNQDVVFLSGGTGGLELADTAANSAGFGGTISGFGQNGQNTKQFILLTGVTSDSTVSLSYNSVTSSSGVLTVTSGGTAVAIIDFAGNYTSGNFHLSAGAGGTVEITDPPVLTQQPTNGNNLDDIIAGENSNAPSIAADTDADEEKPQSAPPSPIGNRKDTDSDNPGSVTLPAAAGHMSPEAYGNLSDIIDKAALQLIPKTNQSQNSNEPDDTDKAVTQLIQNIAGFTDGNLGSHWSSSTQELTSSTVFVPPSDHRHG